MPKFRKKPVVIEAIRLCASTSEEVIDFLGADARNIGWSRNDRTGVVTIVTMEGSMRAENEDWIIRGVKGDLYPCKPDIFAATYEEA